jgi:hypothetical protein
MRKRTPFVKISTGCHKNRYQLGMVRNLHAYEPARPKSVFDAAPTYLLFLEDNGAEGKFFEKN